MEKCYYHPKTGAVTTCIGCKMPVCATCRDEGARGLCDQCARKKAALAEPAAKSPTGGLKAATGAARSPTGSLKPAGGQRPDVVYCFRHKDIRAGANCTTCNRPYCPACLNTSGFCSVCARVNKDAQAKAFGPNQFGQKVLDQQAAEQAAKRLKPRDYIVAGLLVVGLAVSWKILTKPPAKVDETKLTLERLKNSTLTAEEEALLANIKRQKRVVLKEPPKQSQPVEEMAAAGGRTAARLRAAAGAPVGGAPAAAAAGPLEIRAVYPADGAIVGGTTAIRAAIAGAPSSVTCEVDGQAIGAAAGGAPRFLWNTRAAGNGPHQVTITAAGAGGTTTTTFTLNVMNR